MQGFDFKVGDKIIDKDNEPNKVYTVYEVQPENNYFMVEHINKIGQRRVYKWYMKYNNYELVKEELKVGGEIQFNSVNGDFVISAIGNTHVLAVDKSTGIEHGFLKRNIRPTRKYRPFSSREMLYFFCGLEDFSLKTKTRGVVYNHNQISFEIDGGLCLKVTYTSGHSTVFTSDTLFKLFTLADGTVLGKEIK